MLRQLRISDCGLRIADWQTESAIRNPQSEIALDVHASEAGDVGDAVNIAKLADAFCQTSGIDEAVELDENGPFGDAAEPLQRRARHAAARFRDKDYL